MSKIRVYELAKEAGMESKVLTAKLIELGYDVKAYNSTLEADAAKEIRERVLGKKESSAAVESSPPDAEVVSTDSESDGSLATGEKRIQRKGQTTIIRRRAKVVEEPTPVEVEEEPAAAVEAEETKAEAVAEEPVEAAPEAEKETVAEPEAETSVVAEEAAAKEEETPVEEVAAAPPEETPAEPAKEEEKPAPEPSRKGLARVIKRAAVVIPETPSPRPKPSRPERPKRKPAAPAADVASGPSAPAEEGKKGKKGKRFVAFRESDDRDRGKKGAMKRKSGSGLVIDADEVQELGGRLPAAGMRLGRGRRGGGPRKKKCPPEARKRMSPRPRRSRNGSRSLKP